MDSNSAAKFELPELRFEVRVRFRFEMHGFTHITHWFKIILKEITSHVLTGVQRVYLLSVPKTEENYLIKSKFLHSLMIFFSENCNIPSYSIAEDTIPR